MKCQNLFIILLILLTVVSCSKFKENDSLIKVDTEHEKLSTINPYQLGEKWDRQLLENPSHLPFQVFQLYRAGLGAVGTGVYLGYFNKKHLMLTAAHIYTKMQDCSLEADFLLNYNNESSYFFCKGWTYELENSDALIFEINADDESLHKLIPVSFSQQKSTKDLPLKLVSIERLQPQFLFNWFVDDASDCRILGDESKIIKDPDTSELDGNLKSWSLPVGCDGQHGDSGAPVYDYEDKLKGIVWTGKYPKTSLITDFAALDEKELWSELNYIVPIEKIFSEIDYDRAQSYNLSKETIMTLDSLSQKFQDDQLDKSIDSD